MDWTYNPYYASVNTFTDGPDFGTCRVFPTAPVISVHQWELTQQEVYDIRYIKTLQKAIKDARACGG